MSSPCLCLTLRKAARRVTSVYDEALAPVGMNLAQFSLLRHIARLQPLSLTELGRVVELDRSTVGRNVKVLEKMGLTEPVPLADQREAGVQLTTHGLTSMREGERYWNEAQAHFEHKLGKAEFDRLKQMLDSL